MRCGRHELVGRVRHGKKLGGWYTLAIALLRGPMLCLTKRDWDGAEHLLADVRVDGRQVGIVVCPNHISWFDPLQSAHFLYDNGRPPRYLGKEAVFRIPVIGRIIAGAGQIPVYRDTVDAARAVSDAVRAVRSGECVVVYPEGTITRDPDMWPMVGKTGAARIALATGAPVIPLGMWGAQEVIPPYTKTLRLIPRRTMHVVAGPAVDLSDLAQGPLDSHTLQCATDRIMAAITELVEQVRHEAAPRQRFDPRHRARADGGSEDKGRDDSEGEH
jgi:1-acyl-sn-glycerol-3-phosphate acyltransferase